MVMREISKKKRKKKRKRLNKVLPFSVEVVNVFIFNCYLLKSIQFSLQKKRKAIKRYLIGVLGYTEDIIFGYEGYVI